MRAIHCTLVINTSYGYILTPREFNSISEAVRCARESGGFAYRIFADGKVIRKGFCS